MREGATKALSGLASFHGRHDRRPLVRSTILTATTPTTVRTPATAKATGTRLGVVEGIPPVYCHVSARSPVSANPPKMTKACLTGSNPPTAAKRAGGETCGERSSQASFERSSAHKTFRMTRSSKPEVSKTWHVVCSTTNTEKPHANVLFD